MEKCLIQRKTPVTAGVEEGPASNDRERLLRRRLPEGVREATAALATQRLPGTERPQRSKPFGIQHSPWPARLPALPAATLPRRIPAHLSHIVLHLIQVSVFQGPHELLVAHHCSGVGRRAGHKWRVRPTRGHGETTCLRPPGGRDCGPQRRLWREKVLWQPQGPAEQVPPG